MQIQDIKDLMEKMSQTGINTLEFEAEGHRLHLERSGAPAVHDHTGLPSEQYPAWNGQLLSVGPAPCGGAAPAEPAVPAPRGQLVTSPVVGIYYAAASPENDPFVAVGAVVEVGSPLCIIEAMKLMNEVTSAWDGTILEILVENGQRVEFGQPLMRIGGN